MFGSAPIMTVKIAHAAFHSAAIVFIVLGLAVEFIAHQHNDEANLYSLHSWIGMTTIIIFVGQFIFGFICFLKPSLNGQFKALYMPIHVFSGIFCFILAIVTCLVGLNQNARFIINYNELPAQGFLINFIGMMLIVYGAIVVYLVTKQKFKRSGV